jgi:hypothetical protein
MAFGASLCPGALIVVAMQEGFCTTGHIFG